MMEIIVHHEVQYSISTFICRRCIFFLVISPRCVPFHVDLGVLLRIRDMVSVA